MNKIQEVKKKLGEYRENKFLVGCDIHETAADALTVINEQEGEIDRLNREIKRLCDVVATKTAERECAVKELEAQRENCEQLRNSRNLQRHIAQYHERRSVEWQEKYVAANRENEELKGRFACTDLSSLEDAKINNCRLKDELAAAENELIAARKELANEKSKNDDLILKLDELQRKASSFVIEPDEVEKIVCDRCPVCKNDFRLFFKRGIPMLVTRESHRKYANCPKCGGVVNDSENKTACGHCGTLLDWGKQV